MGMRPAWHYSCIQRRPLQTTAYAVHQTTTQACHSNGVDGCSQGQRTIILPDEIRPSGGQKKQGKKPSTDVDPRPYYPMQLDAAKMQRMPEEEHKKLIATGRCFGCKQTAHLYRDCEDRPKHKGKGKQRTPKIQPKPRVRTADASASIKEVSSDSKAEEEKTSKETDAPPAYSKKNLMAAIKKLSMEDRDDLLDTVALNFDQDF